MEIAVMPQDYSLRCRYQIIELRLGRSPARWRIPGGDCDAPLPHAGGAALLTVRYAMGRHAPHLFHRSIDPAAQRLEQIRHGHDADHAFTVNDRHAPDGTPAHQVGDDANGLGPADRDDGAGHEIRNDVADTRSRA